jgi:hypothetical protein
MMISTTIYSPLAQIFSLRFPEFDFLRTFGACPTKIAQLVADDLAFLPTLETLAA